MIFTGILIECNERFGLFVICGYAVHDGLVIGIIGTALNLCTVLKALLDGLILDHDGDNSVHLLAATGKHLIQVRCLAECAGESVQEESGNVFICIESVFNHALNYAVRDKVSGIDQLFGLLAKFCACGYLSAQHLTGAYVL